MFGYTAKQTLDYAQSLYEKKLLTYPRTDSRYLTGDMAETASVVLHLAVRVPPFDASAFAIAVAITGIIPTDKDAASPCRHKVQSKRLAVADSHGL